MSPPLCLHHREVTALESTGLEDHAENESAISPQPSIILVEIDPNIQEKGKELQEVMRLFKESTTQPLSSFVLQTPVHKALLPQPSDHATQGKQRESPHLKAKKIKEKSITKLAQDLVAKKMWISKSRPIHGRYDPSAVSANV
jgi:hypothetical protein